MHIYDPSSAGITLTILPSAPTSLLQRKIAKKISRDPEDLTLYTVRRSQSSVGNSCVPESQEVWVNEKVAKVDEGEVGYWFEDGDGVIIE